MGLVVHRFQSLCADVGVNLRGLQGGMPKEFLHDTKVRTTFMHVGGGAVAQRVRA